MAIKERIEKIKPYFIAFNIAAEDDAAYVLVKFPTTDRGKWEIPNAGLLKEQFSVEIGIRQEGVYFVTEINNGVDCLFDAIDYVVEYNRSIQEKSGLLIQKINELKQLFITEDIERLKTLEFVLKDKKKGSNKNPKKTVKTVEEDMKEIVETTIASEPIKAVESVKTEEINDDNDLMSIAREMVTE